MATLVLLWNHSKRTERMLLIGKFLNNVLSEREAKEILVKYDKSDLTKLPNTNYASVVLPSIFYYLILLLYRSLDQFLFTFKSARKSKFDE